MLKGVVCGVDGALAGAGENINVSVGEGCHELFIIFLRHFLGGRGRGFINSSPFFKRGRKVNTFDFLYFFNLGNMTLHFY